MRITHSYHKNITRKPTLICTFYYYEKLNSRFALEHRSMKKALEMANSKGLSKHTLEYGHQRSSNSLISAVATTTTTTTELPKKSLKCDGLDNYHPGMFYYTSSWSHFTYMITHTQVIMLFWSKIALTRNRIGESVSMVLSLKVLVRLRMVKFSYVVFHRSMAGWSSRISLFYITQMTRISLTHTTQENHS